MNVPPSEPDDAPDAVVSFALSPTDLRARHINVVLGLLLGVGLSLVASWGYGPDSAAPNSLVPLVANLFVAIFGTFVLTSHIRYVYNSRRHRLDVGPDSLTFRTGFDVSALQLSDVAELSRERRLREGPSLRLLLLNSRHVRLVGYQDQERLMALVEQHVERCRANEQR